jgi:hypothetical protein
MKLPFSQRLGEHTDYLSVFITYKSGSKCMQHKCIESINHSLISQDLEPFNTLTGFNSRTKYTDN